MSTSILSTVINTVLGRTNREEPIPPKMYALMLHNDATTNPMFVVRVLSDVCGLTREESTRIMMTAHTSGIAQVRSYSREVAEQRLAQCRAMVETLGENAYDPDAPCELRFTIEPQD